MTHALLPAFTPARLGTVVGLETVVDDIRSVLPYAGCAVPASALTDPSTANWIAAQGVTVVADDTTDVHALCRRGVRPVQVVLHCGSDRDAIRRAVGAGVCRFIADGGDGLAAVAQFSHGRVFVYLDVTAHLAELPSRVEVIGSFRRVDESDGRTGWSAAVLESLCRLAFLRSCGLPPARMVLAGHAERMGSTAGPRDMASIAATVDEALVEGCRTWRLPRPAVTLAGVDWNARPTAQLAPPEAIEPVVAAA